MRETLIILLFIHLSLLVYSQNDVHLVVVNEENEQLKFLKKQSYNTKFSDTLLLNVELEKIISKCYTLGYIESSFDRLWRVNDTLFANLVLGDKYYWDALRFSNMETELIRSLGVKEKTFSNRTFVYDDLLSVQNKILTFYENV